MEFNSIQELRNQLAILEQTILKLEPIPPSLPPGRSLLNDILGREQFHTDSIKLTIEKAEREVQETVETFRQWMENRTIVRMIAAGRAKLAGAIPANRLAHGGARLYIVDDLVPMPHTYRAGGIIAVSASGRTQSVLDALRKARENSSGITVIGIAAYDAREFAGLCDIFIGIRTTTGLNPLRALADTEEYILSRLLDAMVVAAGRAAGYDETTWRLGHENLGPTGPYDVKRKPPRSPLLYYSEAGFLGRATEVQRILDFLCSNNSEEKPKVLCVAGELGVGKRRLVNEALRLAASKHKGGNSPEVINVSAYWRSWPTVIAMANARRQSQDDSAPTDLLVPNPKKSRLWLVIDNIDSREFEDGCQSDLGRRMSGGFVDFVDRWPRTAGSRLIFTTNQLAKKIRKVIKNCEIIELKGIDSIALVEQLLGEDARNLLQQNGLLEQLADLRGNPQRIRYLRFLCEAGASNIKTAVRDLGGCRQEKLSSLSRSGLPLAPFLALGGLRNPEFSEALMQYLWDGMDRGGAGLYHRFVDELLSLGLLIREKPEGNLMRLHAEVHAEVRKAQIEELLPIRAHEGVHFIGQFYRSLVAAEHSRNQMSPKALDDLEQYVYYSVCYGKTREVHQYIFSSGYLAEAFERGQASKLLPILKHLSDGLKYELSVLDSDVAEEKKTGIPGSALRRQAELRLMLAQVEAEFGRVYKDRSEYNAAIASLDHARTLEYAAIGSGTVLPEFEERCAEIESVVYHYQGIALSQMGDTHDCWRTYATGVFKAMCNCRPSLRDILSLGYLAYEMKFHDMDLALSLGQLAVQSAQILIDKIDDKSVLVKNLCSLGQIQSFALMGDLSRETFQRAFNICNANRIGTREMCRIYVNSTVTEILLSAWDAALHCLNEADRGLMVGDERRRWMATAYRGILTFRRGKGPNYRFEAQSLIEKALENHMGIAAWREIVYEAMTLAWMNDYDPKLSLIAKNKSLKPFIRKAAKMALEKKNILLFEDFWNKHYAPALLGRR